SGRPGEADAQFKTALALMEALHRERSVSASVLRLNWAVTLIQAGVPRPALDLLDLDLDIERQDFPDAPLPARMVFSKAGAEIEMGRFAESIAGLRQALLLAGAAHDVVVMFGAHCAMATALANLGRTADAEREFGLARSMHGPALEAGPLARNTLRLTRAALDLIEGLYAQARTAADAVLSATAASKAHRAQALLSRAEAEVGMARGAEALSDADACVALSRALQGHLPASSRTGKGMLVRAQALQLLGRTSEARESAAGAVRELTSTVDGSYPALRAAIAFLPD
ncbi:MAG: hypothetical protein KGJ30_09990, partial [Burkholderiales bacterium]|nr:hypothetical protein [Burkholderiales bacterium]